MEDRKRGRDDDEGGAADAGALPAVAPTSSPRSSSNSAGAAAAGAGRDAVAPALVAAGPGALATGGPAAPAQQPPPPPPPPPFHGPAADSALGERCIDVLPIVSASGYAAEVSQCRWLCGETWRAGSLGATNDMLVRSAEIQCGARAAREMPREDFVHRTGGGTFRRTTQLIRAALLNNLPRVLLLVQLGAPLDLVERSWTMSALHGAALGGLLQLRRCPRGALLRTGRRGRTQSAGRQRLDAARDGHHVPPRRLRGRAASARSDRLAPLPRRARNPRAARRRPGLPLCKTLRVALHSGSAVHPAASAAASLQRARRLRARARPPARARTAESINRAVPPEAVAPEAAGPVGGYADRSSRSRAPAMEDRKRGRDGDEGATRTQTARAAALGRPHPPLRAPTWPCCTTARTRSSSCTRPRTPRRTGCRRPS